MQCVFSTRPLPVVGGVLEPQENVFFKACDLQIRRVSASLSFLDGEAALLAIGGVPSVKIEHDFPP